MPFVLQMRKRCHIWDQIIWSSNFLAMGEIWLGTPGSASEHMGKYIGVVLKAVSYIA